MTAAKRAKQLGCKSLAQVSKQTGQSLQTLDNWFKNKPELFDIVCKGVANEQSINLNNQTTDTTSATAKSSGSNGANS